MSPEVKQQPPAAQGVIQVFGLMSLWKDVRDTTRRHVMGYTSAAIGIFRRTGLGKVGHLNRSLLWDQEKEASRELQYRQQH